MRFRVISRYIGMVLLLESVFMLIAAAISYHNGMDTGFMPLIISFGITAAISIALILLGTRSKQISSKEGYFIVIGAWLVSCLVGTMPYLFWGGDFNFINAWFESVSGFTTTGSTILRDIEALPDGLLFWRSSTHWIGGVGVVMFTLTILPSIGSSRIALSSVEISQLAKDNYNYRTKKVIRILLMVYLGMTAAELVLLKIAGMNWFDAVNHAFSTIATGGFSTKNLSIGAFDSVWIETIISVFTFMSGIHFGLIFATIIGRSNNIFRSEVFRYYFISLLVGIAFMTFNLWNSGTYDTLGEALRKGAFQATSIVTTTGFATADTTLWPSFSMAILFFFTIQCACAGSTSGGLKCDRVLLAFKVIKAKIRQQQHPNAIIRIKLNGITQEDSTVNFAMLYIVVYFLLILLGMLVNTAAGLDFTTALSASATCMSNVGPGFGEIGSLSNFFALPDVIKVSSTLLMLLGRLEIFGLIQLFLLKWWV